MSSDTDNTNSGPEPDAATADANEESEANAPLDAAAVSTAAADDSEAGENIASDNASDNASIEDQTPHLSVVPVAELDAEQIRCVIEAALFAADDALTIDRLFKLFMPGELGEEGGRGQVRDALAELGDACEGRGFELKKVASGYRMQVRQGLSPWVSRLWEEKPPRYTRALLETMALIAYKQPATRGDIEEVRGVTVSTNIMRTLLERGWIREVGQRDVPGRPSMYGTTKDFLDYFNLSSLDELPGLPELRELVEPAPVAEEVPEDAVSEQADDGAAEAADSVPVVADAEGDNTEEALDELLDDIDQAVEQKDEAGQAAERVAQPADAVEVVDSSDDEAPGDTQDLTPPVTSQGPVFADNELVVVSEHSTGEIAVDESPMVDATAALPSAEGRE